MELFALSVSKDVGTVLDQGQHVASATQDSTCLIVCVHLQLLAKKEPTNQDRTAKAVTLHVSAAVVQRATTA